MRALLAAQNERVETITLNVWLEVHWQDPMLKWDAEIAGVKKLLVPAGDIWLPDLSFDSM